jgi:hypothetical protein
MRNGVCPKCNSTEIYRKVNGIGLGDANGRVYIFTGWLTSPTDVEAFICIFCGFFETFAIDRNKLDEVTQSWEKVVK